MNSERYTNSRDAGSDSSAQADVIHSSLVHQLYTRGGVGHLGAFFGATVLSISLWDLLPHSYLIIWLTAYAIIQISRHILVKRYFRALRHNPNTTIWERRYAVGNILGGLLWGSAAIFLFPQNSVPHQYMMALFIAGISCGAAVFYWPSNIASVPTIILELIPISGRFFFKADETGTITGIVLLFFCGIVLILSRNLKSFAIGSLKLGLEREGLLDSLRISRDELEAKVKQRTIELSHINNELRHEIKERIRAEESLSKSEERYREVVEHVQESIIVAHDGWLKFVNPATIELFEYSQSELLSKPFAEFIHPDDRELVCQNHLKRTREESLPRRYSFRVLHKTGGIRWVEITNVIIQWDGRPAVLIFMTDISDRREAEEALRESEERYRSLVENLNDIVFSTDLEGRITYISPAIERKSKFSIAEIIGRRFTEFIHPDDLLRVAARYAQVMKGDLKTAEYRLVTKDGDSFHVLSNSRPLYQNGQLIGLTGLITDVTERKQTEKALEQSETNLRSIFNAICEALFLLKKDGEILAANDTFAARIGKNNQEVIGKCVYDYLPPDAGVRLRRQMESVVRVGVPMQTEDRIYARDVSHAIFPVFGDQGLVDRIAVYSADITERKNTEEAARKSEERFRLAMEAANDGIWDRDIQTDKMYYSPGYYRMLGYESLPLEMGLQSWSDLIHVDDRKKVSQAHDDCIEGRCDSFEAEFRMMHKSGEWHWILGRGKSVGRDANGRSVRMIGTHVDIDRLKKAQEAIQESERRFRLLLEDVSSVAVQGYDENRSVVFWNSASERLYGYSRDEVLGRQLEDLIIPWEMREEVVSAVENWIAKGERIPSGELALTNRNGSIVPVYSTHVMLDIPGGKKEMYCVDVDLSNLRKAEEERASLKDQLRQAQKMEAIGTLAGGIAHDFNNLLQVTMGYSEFLLEGKAETDPEYGDLQKIYRAARSGAQLVRNLLTFSRKAEPNPLPMNLNHEIRHVEELLHRVIPKMIDIRLDLADDLEMINADKGQIEQIVMNLAVNARDALGEQGSLGITTENVILDEQYCRFNVEAKPGNYVLLSVSDTGHGMDNDTIEHIFEPFYTTKAIGRGTGLGLAMVHGIVKQHGGHIKCYSSVGKGTTFKIYLPAIDMNQEKIADSLAEIPAFGTETILLVDDEEFVRDLGERILTKRGYTVLSAINGEQALEIYGREKENIGLIILDLIMPIMGGKDCLRKITEIDPQAKVIIASGYSADASANECSGLGAKGFVSKPFRFKELLRQVRKTLDEK